MSKKVFTADLHLQLFDSDNIQLESGISLKLHELLNAITQVFDYAVKNKIDTVIFGGDISHKRKNVDVKPFHLFQELLIEYSDRLNYIFIPGNHDGDGLFRGQTAVSFFKTIPNSQVFDFPTVIDNITYIPDSQDMLQDIHEAEPTDILISHFALSEAATDSGLKVITKFSKKDLKKFKLVLLGDYHTFQKIDNIYYPGTLIPMNRGEKGPKGFIVFDDESMEVEFIETTGFRRYIDVEINENTNIEEVKKILQNKTETNDYIVVHNNLPEIPIELKVVMKEEAIPIIDKYEPEEIIRGISSNMNLGEQMKKYLELSGIPEKEMDLYLNIGMEALRETDNV